MRRHLVVIGGQRCGTTFLYELLDAHPDIAMAKPRAPEPKFFLKAEEVSRGLAWYEAKYFPDAAGAVLLGEKSTSYMESPSAAERAAELIPSAYVVALLRDPIARAVSNWRFSHSNGLEDRPLEKALEDSLKAPREWDPGTTSVSPFDYLKRGHYAALLSPWLERFPGRLEVLFLADLVKDNAVVTELYGTLGVDRSFAPRDIVAPVNDSKGPRATLSGSLERKLRRHYAESDRQLRDVLGRALPWDP